MPPRRGRRGGRRLAAALALLAVAACSPPAGEWAPNGEPPPPNVILISLDTLRADHLGSYGYQRPTSPNLDRFAAEDAVLFEQVVNTGGATLPVHTSMFTSLPPAVHDVWPDNGGVLAPERVTLAEQLAAAGYATAAYTGGGFVIPKFGLDQGFDRFEPDERNFATSLPRARRWVRRHAGRPFFLFLHTYDVHSAKDRLPYDSPDGFNDLFTAGYEGDFDGCLFETCASELLALLNQRTQSGKVVPAEISDAATLDYVIGLYDGGIAYVDRELGEFFDYLRTLGLYDDSLIVVTSDHGEEFLEHGLFLHHQNFEEVALVPMFVKLPRNRGGGRRIGGQVSTLEVMPTILDVVGIEPHPQVQGRSVGPLIAGDWDGYEEVLVGSNVEKLRTPRWSLMVAPRGQRRLFDRQRDPAEKVDHLRQHPEVAQRLTASYRRMVAEQGRLKEALASGTTELDPDLSREEIERLRALGYLN